MHRGRILRNALLVTIFLVILLAGIASAESRTVWNVTGNTWHTTGYYNAQTTSGFQAPYIYVNIRAWGEAASGSGRAIKEEEQNSKYNAHYTNVVNVWDGWSGATWTSRHVANTQYGSVEIHTSATGCTSSYCWWNTGSLSCAGTC